MKTELPYSANKLKDLMETLITKIDKSNQRTDRLDHFRKDLAQILKISTKQSTV